MPIKTHEISLLKATWITPQVKHFVFKTSQDVDFKFKPGQFITMHFSKDDKKFRRSYSLANLTRHSNIIEFAAGFVENGPGSEILFNLKTGDTISINGPFGRLILKEEEVQRYILIATSTGVTPYLSMINNLNDKLNNNPELEVVIMLGVQRREDLLYPDNFLSFSQQHPRAHFKAFYSRDSLCDRNEYEHKGYVQSGFDDLKLNPQRDIIYLCGNPAMIDESFDRLKEMGFDVGQIRREKYISN